MSFGGILIDMVIKKRYNLLKKAVNCMISSLSKFVSLFLCKKKVVKQEELEVYQYGFEVIFSTIVGIMLTLIVGLLYHKIWLSLLYNAIFSLLRQKTGGYHANTYLTCNFCFYYRFFKNSNRMHVSFSQKGCGRK